MVQRKAIVNNIFEDDMPFESKVLQIYRYQLAENSIYRQWAELTGADMGLPSYASFPFLPISFFKTHAVKTGVFEAGTIFESSGTTTSVNSKHYIKDIAIYRQSFMKAFDRFYGPVTEWCVIGLLPSYLERQHSSLVLMADTLIKESGHTASGFYLYEFDRVKELIEQLEQQQQKTLLIGVTFALLDFAAVHSMQLKYTTIMETGGMKGRRREIIRQEVHAILRECLGVQDIHAEYGMTELLSQAYSRGNGRFYCPPWMKVLVRDEEDPLQVSETGKGILNIIDLANIDSCSFIATDDIGIVYADGSFEVQGRMDYSDIRGCSLMVAF